MDGIEEEDVVEVSPPTDLQPIKQRGAHTPKEDDNQDEASQANSRRAPRQSQGRLPEDQALYVGGQPAAANSHPGGKSSNVGAAGEPSSKTKASQNFKLRRERTATPYGTGEAATQA